MEVFVTNNNAFHHTDMYDGREFLFPMGEKVLVPQRAATHMLGFGLADKSDTLTRLGWANMENDEGVKRLARFVFTQAVTVEVPAVPEPKAA
jgi:hypothetical protein